MRNAHRIAGFLAFALFWSGTGDSSNPELRPAELPADILAQCAAATPESEGDCKAEYRIGWVNRTPLGELFLVERAACGSEGCPAWLVLRTTKGHARTMLGVNGEVRLQHGKPYPAVVTRLELAGSYTSYNRYEWRGEGYVRVETRLMHRVDDLECGDAKDCIAAADAALRRNQSGRAVRIWQQVHGVSWI